MGVSYTKLVSAVGAVETLLYATGDLVGGKLSLVEAGRSSPNTGLIHSVVIRDQANQKVAFDVVFFSADPTGTTFTENAALDVADADLAKVLGVVQVVASDYVTLSDNAVATRSGLGLPYELGGSTLYAALITRGAPTFAAATDLSLAVGLLQD